MAPMQDFTKSLAATLDHLMKNANKQSAAPYGPTGQFMRDFLQMQGDARDGILADEATELA